MIQVLEGRFQLEFDDSCVFEDIDAIIKTHQESELLQWLDGAQQINTVVNLATTNYPEQLDRRILCRPRRFDRVIKIDGASDDVRRQYLAKKLPGLRPDELADWIEKTEDLSFAGLSE